MDVISEIAFRCLESSRSGIVICDSADDLPIIYCNESFCSLTGYSRSEVIGQNCRFLQRQRSDENVNAAIRRAIGENRTHRVVLKNWKKDGTPFWNDLFITPIWGKGGEVTHYLGIQNDLRALDRNYRNIPFYFPYDDLTQLPTAVTALEVLKKLSASSDGKTGICLGTITVNGLAHLRGFLNNSAGDVALLEIRDRLQKLVAEPFILARAGEYEFVVAGLVNSKFDVKAKFEELCACVLKPVLIDTQRFQLTYNGGLVRHLPLSMIDDSVRLCSFALAQSQAEGSNQIFEYFVEDLGRKKDDQILAGSIPLALKQGQFYCVYQPQIDLATGRSVGFEALARWTHPDLGDISPARFIPLCESSGYINAVTIEMLIQICRDIPTLDSKFGDVGISVNLSPLSLLDSGFLKTFISVLENRSVRRGKISVEIVENLSIEGYESASSNIDRLKDAGVSIILDDFGTGYSSLSYIKHLGASVVKIDRIFVMHLSRSNLDDLGIVKAVVALGRQFNFEVIAEGVETKEQANILYQEGIRIGQGYYFAKPRHLQDLVIQA